MAISPKKRSEVLDALRRGTVPHKGLEELAVGLNQFQSVVDEQLDKVAEGGAEFKAIRGDYGCGKTFFSRWIQERAKRMNFAISEVQISETETPLHRLETVYRRLIERLATATVDQGAFRDIIDGWFFSLEEELIQSGTAPDNSQAEILERANELMEKRLAEVSRHNSQFSAVLRAYRDCLTEEDQVAAEGLLAWLAGQPNISAQIKRKANIKGEIDHFGAMNFLQGLLRVLRDSSYAGMVLVLDEVETLQRMRSDVREKALNALRQLIDEIDSGRYPGLFLVVTGTPTFFDGPQGIRRLPPLAQRLHTDFDESGRFDNPRAPQIRLQPLQRDGLIEVGAKVRDLYAADSPEEARIRNRVDDSVVGDLADGVAGTLGGKVGIAPRIFLKKLISDVLDRVEQFEEFEPRRDYQPIVEGGELTEDERAESGLESLEKIKLDWK